MLFTSPCGAISSGLSLLVRLKMEKTCMYVQMLLSWEHRSCQRCFYSANEVRRSKLVIAVCQRKSGYPRDRPGISTQTLHSEWKGIWRISWFAVTYDLLSRMLQRWDSWKPEGNSSHASKRSIPGIATQLCLMPFICFMLFSLELVTLLVFGGKQNTGSNHEGV